MGEQGSETRVLEALHPPSLLCPSAPGPFSRSSRLFTFLDLRFGTFARITRRRVRRDRDPCGPRLIDGLFQESLPRLSTVPRGQVGIDRTILIDRTINVGPFPVEGREHIVNVPCLADRSRVSMGSVTEQRGWPPAEALAPALARAASDNEATLGKPRNRIGIAQGVANIRVVVVTHEP